jgi:hypothetical protein
MRFYCDINASAHREEIAKSSERKCLLLYV